MTDAHSAPRSPGPAWAGATAVLTVLAAALSLHLAQAQLLLTHGTAQGGACLPGSGCAAALTQPGATLSGVPLVVWALPVHLLILFLLRPAAAHGQRGADARGGLIVLSVGLALLSLLAVGLALPAGGASCMFCLALAGLHVGIAGLAIAPSGQRRPAVPSVDDWLPAMLVGLTAVMGAGFGARIVGFHLDQQAEAALAEPALVIPADAAVAVEMVESGPVAVPPTRSPAPVDDQDPSVGPLTAKVTVVAFLDLQDERSRQLAWNLAELEPAYQDRVRFITKHLPMDASCNSKRRRTTHPRACAVAVALQCAHLQGGFRGYRQQLLRNWQQVDDDDLVAYAAQLGLDVDAFAACRSGDAGIDAVEADVKQAGKGTLIDPPWVFVEGRVLEGVADPAQLEATIAVALGERTVDANGQAMARLAVVAQASDPLGPTEMVQIAATSTAPVWMDAVEGSLDQAGAALAIVGAQPHPVDLATARQACQASGRRLCRRSEWVAACQGTAAVDQDGSGDAFDDQREGRLQPYGDPWRSGWCADQDLAAAGAHPACRTPQGVLDLAGNMGEWVEEGLLLGGAAGDGRQIGCHQALVPPGPGWRTDYTGFRCCADAVQPALTGSPQAPAVLPTTSLPDPLRQAAGPGPVLVVPWRTDCGPCQQALVLARESALVSGATVVALSVQADSKGAREWLTRGGLSLVAVDDPDASISGAIGLPGLPWLGAYDSQGQLVKSWQALPAADALTAALVSD